MDRSADFNGSHLRHWSLCGNRPGPSASKCDAKEFSVRQAPRGVPHGTCCRSMAVPWRSPQHPLGKTIHTGSARDGTLHRAKCSLNEAPRKNVREQG